MFLSQKMIASTPMKVDDARENWTVRFDARFSPYPNGQPA